MNKYLKIISNGSVYVDEYITLCKLAIEKMPPMGYTEKHHMFPKCLCVTNEEKVDKENLSRSLTGRLFSVEHLSNLSISAKNKPKVSCEHCDKLMIKSNYTKWHGEKCKEKGYV
jgi:hypothetical protein